MNMSIGLLLLFSVVVVPLASTQEATKPPANCQAVCFAYTNDVIKERRQAIDKGCPSYISVLSDPVVARVRLAPELTGGLDSAVDDHLYLRINGRTVWQKSYKDLNGTENTFKKDQLTAGKCNAIELYYLNTQPPDAHFMAELGGQAFCGSDGMCNRKYREGITFGTGLIYKSPSVAASMWKSELKNPNDLGCKCTDPTAAELNKSLESKATKKVPE